MTVALDHTPEGRRASATPPVLRLDPADLAEVLDRLGDRAALAAGLVNVIGLDGVAARFGTRWNFRRELVYEHVERVMRRRLGGAGVFQRIGEAHYVVVQSGRSRLQAQGVCLDCLREILNHFVGEVRLPDMRLHEVSRITQDELVGHRIEVPAAAAVDPVDGDVPAPRENRSFANPRSFLGARTFAAPDDQALTFTRASHPSPTGRPHMQLAQWTPFVASNGRTVRVSCALEPVIKLSNSTRIGFRLARRVLDAERVLTGPELRNLSRADIARVDFATIARGVDRLHAEEDGEKLPSLIVPVSYATLSNQRSREVLVGLLEQARAEVRLGLVCEICELEGVPPSALLTAVSLIKPFCMRILAFVSDPRPIALKPLKGLGLAGVSMDCPVGLGDAEFVGWVGDAARAAHSVAGALMLYRVHPIERGALAALAGASHVSLLATTERPPDA